MAGRLSLQAIIEGIKTGGKNELSRCCAEVIRRWRDIETEPLLKLKDTLSRMGLEQREAELDEALISVASKRPEPFREIVSDPSHPLWKPAVEIISATGGTGGSGGRGEGAEGLELLLGMLPSVPRKNLPDLIRAIGRFKTGRAVEKLAPFIFSEDESAAFEAMTAIRDNGDFKALKILKEALKVRKSSMLEEIVREMEKRLKRRAS